MKMFAFFAFFISSRSTSSEIKCCGLKSIFFFSKTDLSISPHCIFQVEQMNSVSASFYKGAVSFLSLLCLTLKCLPKKLSILKFWILFWKICTRQKYFSKNSSPRKDRLIGVKVDQLHYFYHHFANPLCIF
jgi:hypothetical protein